MYSADLIPKQVSDGLQAGYDIRPLKSEDYENGMLDVLSVLTTVGTISKEEFTKQYEYWSKHDDTYFPVIIADQNQRVVACGMLLVERKLIHERGLVGHIEDIAVATNQQGNKLGKRLIDSLSGIAKKVGCYKVILDCDPKNTGFYEKCGYKQAGIEMDLRF